MFHVMGTHMFYKPVFPHISHSVAVHKPCTIRELVIVFYFMYHYLVHLQPGLFRTWCGFPFFLKACCSVAVALSEEVLPPASLPLALLSSSPFLSEPSYSDFSIADLSMLRLFSSLLCSDVRPKRCFLLSFKLKSEIGYLVCKHHVHLVFCFKLLPHKFHFFPVMFNRG